jgi:DNA polymerase delta subunit 1
MVNFGVNTVEEAMKLGKEAAQFISQTFIKPISLEFEKVYFPYLLINKKRYAGLFWTKPDKFDKLDAKGIESVRRDNCRLVKNVIDTCLDQFLIERNVEAAITYVKNIISDLLQNKIDLSLLVITKALSKEGKEYKSKQAHVELVERMKKRDSQTAPSLGDRIPYVIIRAQKNAQTFKKSEDPLFVLENNIPIDTQYYLDNQLKKPLIRIFTPIMNNVNSLFVGDHTRIICQPTPKTGGLFDYMVTRPTCLGCKTKLPKDEKLTCLNCRHKESELYQQHLLNSIELEKKFSKTWTQCQICQGSLHQEVLCSSRDCPIFYMRKQVQKDLNESIKILDRFNIEW